MSKKLILPLLFILLLGSSITVTAQKKSAVAKLKGVLIDMGSSVILEDFSDLQNMLPKNHHPVIHTGSDSTFSLEVPISKPGYFRLGRNKLYLSPGDDLEMTLDHNNSAAAKIKGRGAEANIYLKNTYFPKSGSYLESGKNIKATPKETLDFIYAISKKRTAELQALKGVSAEFKRLETARIRADMINSIEKTSVYAYPKFSKESRQFTEQYLAEFVIISKPVRDSLVKNFIDPSFLQVEVYRDMNEKLIAAGSAEPQKLKVFNDYNEASILSRSKIIPLTDKSLLQSLQKSVDSIQTKKYRDALSLLIREKSMFGNGDPAIDIVVRNVNGTTVSLSSLKGKLIYIDVWATWCGPCLAEMPELEKLKKKYETNPDIAIVSLSVDENDPVWLRNLESRKPGGIQWRINRADLGEYQIQTIPRYIIIDQRFKIADINAGAPSEKSLQEKLDKLLAG